MHIHPSLITILRNDWSLLAHLANVLAFSYWQWDKAKTVPRTYSILGLWESSSSDVHVVVFRRAAKKNMPCINWKCVNSWVLEVVLFLAKKTLLSRKCWVWSEMIISSEQLTSRPSRRFLTDSIAHLSNLSSTGSDIRLSKFWATYACPVSN